MARMASRSHLSFSTHVLYSFLYYLFSYCFILMVVHLRLGLARGGASFYRRGQWCMAATAPHHEYGKICFGGLCLVGWPRCSYDWKLCLKCRMAVWIRRLSSSLCYLKNRRFWGACACLICSILFRFSLFLELQRTCWASLVYWCPRLHQSLCNLGF